MKSFVLAVAAMIVISATASAVLNSGFQKGVEQAYSTQGARVGH